MEPRTPVRSKTAWRPVLLWGLASPRADLVLTAATAVVLLVSRFALLPSGPWEWDETIFARGMLHFQLAPHFPQPPGFPGLLALGRMLLPLAGEPIVALQWVNALASVLMVWPLASLGRRVAPAPVAAAAALLVSFLPGPWLFSVRGFSSIPAAALAVGAAALWAGGLAGRRSTWFTLLLTASFLVRPVLLPTVGLLWLLGAAGVRPRTRLLPGVALGAAAVAVAVAAMAALEGGWHAFVTPFVTHAEFHAARLHLNSDDVHRWGLLTGVGGAIPALSLAALSVVGLVRWRRRRGHRAVVVWLLVLAVTLAQLFWLQNRTYSRYAAIVHTAVAPLLAGAAALLPAPLAVTGLLGLTAGAAWWSAPLLAEQHRELFGAWQATLEAESRAESRGWTVVVGPEIYPFASYRWHVLEAEGRTPPPMVLTPRAPEPWPGVAGPWVVATAHPELYPPSLSGREETFGDVSPRLVPLTQWRFLTAAVLEDTPLPVGPWWARETAPDGGSFMWAGADAELWLPPVPRDTWIGLELRPAPGDEPLRVEVDGPAGTTVVDGHAPRGWVWARRDEVVGSAPVIVRLARARGYRPGGEDARELSLQLFATVVRTPGSSFGGPAATPAQRAELQLATDDAYPAETFGDAGEGAWLRPDTGLVLGVPGPGELVLLLSAPRPRPPETRITVAGRDPVPVPELDSVPRLVTLTITAANVVGGEVALRLESAPFVPAAAGLGDDPRPLGIVLHRLEFRGSP